MPPSKPRFKWLRRPWDAALCAAALLLLNVYIVKELFAVEYSRYTGSIDASYIAISRYVATHGIHLGWFPLWYGGIPYQDSYPPLLSLLVAGFMTIFKTSPALSYHIVIAAIYCAGCLTLFWLAYRLSGKLLYSFLAGLLFSTFSPANFLISDIRGDASGLWNPRRLQVLVQYGEGPHILSLLLVPVAIVALRYALSKKSPLSFLVAALAMAGAVLANWIGAVALALAVLSYLLSVGASRKDWLTTAGIGLFSYALVCPWILPSTLAVIRRNAEHIEGDYPMTVAHWLGWIPCLIGLLLLWCILGWLRATRELRFAAYLFWLTSYITLSWYWMHFYVLPQPHRYHIEMEMAAVLLFVFCLKGLIGADPGRTARYAVIGVCLLLAARGLVRYRKSAVGIDQAIDIQQTSEYKISDWLRQNAPDKRAFVAGSTAFWLNVFSNTPELGGGFDQGITNPVLPHVIYQIYSGDGAGARETEIAITWLKAFGVQTVAVTGPGSTEPYKPFKNPHKFDNALPLLWTSGGDSIYSVTGRPASLAHVVHPGDTVQHPPQNGLDVGEATRYVKALEDRSLPVPDFAWRTDSSATATANLQKSDLLSIQVGYHPGWHARVNGESRRVSSDGLGLLLVVPNCEGRCTVELSYDGGTEMKIAQRMSIAAGAGGIAWVLWSYIRRRRPTTPRKPA